MHMAGYHDSPECNGEDGKIVGGLVRIMASKSDSKQEFSVLYAEKVAHYDTFPSLVLLTKSWRV